MIRFFTSLDVWSFFMLNNLAGLSPTLDFIIVFFAEYLAFIIPVVFLILLYRATTSFREKVWIVGLAFISAFFAKLVVTDTIRLFCHRPRPFLTLNVHQLLTEPAYSFPSAHASFFFAFAFTIYFYEADAYGRLPDLSERRGKKWGKWFLIGALLISIGRVMAGVHYPSDILGGAVVGFASGYIMFKYLGPVLLKVINRFV